MASNTMTMTLAGKRVLTVDDSHTIRTFMRGLLSARQAKVDEASTGQEALDLLKDGKKYDLFLLDLLLPDLDGIHLLKQIREQDEEATVVMLTGAGDVKSATVAVQQGADGYLEKQDLSFGGDYLEFFYSLEQAMSHRAGIVARFQLDQMRADFYSMVTHDLRNPASAILVTTELLRDEGMLSENQQELIGIIEQSAERFLQLINDYLDFAKIDAGYLRLDPNETDLTMLTRSVSAMAARQAHARDQSLRIELPEGSLLAYVDARRLEQLLENLLSNAIKFTPKGGRVMVKLEAAGNQALFTVSDSGIGIPADQLQHLFSKYYRVSGAATRDVLGTGLGLLIAKEIAEAHGGTIGVESAGTPGDGSTFHVRIPLMAHRVAEQLQPTGAAAPHQPE